MTKWIAQQWNKIGDAFEWHTNYKIDQITSSDVPGKSKAQQMEHRGIYYQKLAHYLRRVRGFNFEYPQDKDNICWSVCVFLEEPHDVKGPHNDGGVSYHYEIVLERGTMSTVRFYSKNSFNEALLAALIAFIQDPLFPELKEKGMLRI